jgi:ketosteroid isomerase-like protein
MSQENVEIVRRCCEAFNRGDYEAALDALDPDIEWDRR